MEFPEHRVCAQSFGQQCPKWSHRDKRPVRPLLESPNRLHLKKCSSRAAKLLRDLKQHKGNGDNRGRDNSGICVKPKWFHQAKLLKLTRPYWNLSSCSTNISYFLYLGTLHQGLVHVQQPRGQRGACSFPKAGRWLSESQRALLPFSLMTDTGCGRRPSPCPPSQRLSEVHDGAHGHLRPSAWQLLGPSTSLWRRSRRTGEPVPHSVPSEEHRDQ